MSDKRPIDLQFGDVSIWFESDDIKDLSEHWERAKAAVDTYIEETRKMEDSEGSEDG